MKLSISVMAHPSRTEFFPYLENRLGNIPIIIDEGWGLWENSKRAWRLHEPDSDWHIVIQDDAIICDNFRKEAQMAIEKARGIFLNPNYAVSLFFGKRKLMMDVGKQGLKAGFVIKAMLHWGLAVCLPTNLIEDMIAFGDKMDIKQDDARISHYLMHKKFKVYYPMPSLVDHRIGKSLVNDPGNGRKAYAYAEKIPLG